LVRFSALAAVIALSNIRPIAVMPALAWSLPIAFVLTMIEGRRLLLPGRLVKRRQCFEPVAMLVCHPARIARAAPCTRLAMPCAASSAWSRTRYPISCGHSRPRSR
jgi:hypothetical protein